MDILIKNNISVSEEVINKILSKQPDKNKVIELIQGWINDPSGYDEKVWPLIEKDLKDLDV